MLEAMNRSRHHLILKLGFKLRSLASVVVELEAPPTEADVSVVAISKGVNPVEEAPIEVVFPELEVPLSVGEVQTEADVPEDPPMHVINLGDSTAQQLGEQAGGSGEAALVEELRIQKVLSKRPRWSLSNHDLPQPRDEV